LTFEYIVLKLSLFSSPKFRSLRNLILLVLLSISVCLSAQHKVGVRAGTNYAKFSGPLEEAESYSLSGGIHFGINYTYLLNDKFSIRAEILYQQKGTKQNFFDDDVYTLIKPITAGVAEFVDYGTVERDLKITNSYFSVPLTVQFQLSRKFEVFGGLSVDFLLGSNGRGAYDYESRDSPLEIAWNNQSLDFRYNSDVGGQYNSLAGTIAILIDGEPVEIPKVIGAYYYYINRAELESRFKSVDFTALGGVNYFINPGFYIGARLEYGLTDLTRTDLDVSLRELADDNSYILRDDKDASLNLAISFGFRF